MRLPSFAIASLMCVVAIAAVDGYLLRQIDLGEDDVEILSAAGIFVMVNILAVGLLRIVGRRGRTGPFLVGFEIGGTLAILAYMGCFHLWPELMDEVWATARRPIEDFFDAHAPRWVCACFYQEHWDEYPAYRKFPMLFAVLPFMTVPWLLAQLTIAVAGGWTAGVISGKIRASRSTNASLA